MNLHAWYPTIDPDKIILGYITYHTVTTGEHPLN